MLMIEVRVKSSLKVDDSLSCDPEIRHESRYENEYLI